MILEDIIEQVQIEQDDNPDIDMSQYEIVNGEGEEVVIDIDHDSGTIYIR